MKKDYYHSLDFLRFVFMLFICVWHYVGTFPWLHLTHGYVGVEFFFILSGALLYKSFLTHSNQGALAYTEKKIKKFYFEYLLTLILLFCIFRYNSFLGDFNTSLLALLNFVQQALFLQNLGIFSDSVNPPAWYLSVLIYMGALLYSCLRLNKRYAIGLFFPLLCLLGFSSLFSFSDSLDSPYGTHMGVIDIRLIRGASEMSLGILLYYFYCAHLNYFNGRRIPWLDAVSILSLFLLIVFMFSTDTYDKFSIILFSMLILASFNRTSLLNRLTSHSIWEKLGSITYEMLIIHFFIRSVFLKLKLENLINSYLLLTIYLITVILGSFLLKRFDQKVKEVWISKINR